MDKVLAFSILSASPADISAGAGFGGSGARLSWRRGADDQPGQAAAAAAAAQQERRQREEQMEGKEKRAGSRARSHGSAAAAAAPRFALELDGIDCFETIVSH